MSPLPWLIQAFPYLLSFVANHTTEHVDVVPRLMITPSQVLAAIPDYPTSSIDSLLSYPPKGLAHCSSLASNLFFILHW